MVRRSETRARKPTKRTLFNLIPIRAVIIVVVLAAVIMGAALYSIPPAHVQGGDWPSFIGNNNNSRYQINSTINYSNVGQLKQKWFINTAQYVTSTPLVLNGVVYFADWGGNVYAVSLATGAIIWKTNLDKYVSPTSSGKAVAISSTLSIANGKIYVADGLGTVAIPQTYLFTLNQTNGSVIWTVSNNTFKTSMNSMWGSPTYYNGTIYVGVSGTPGPTLDNSQFKIGAIYAVNSQTGALVWKFVTMTGNEGGAGVWGTTVIDPDLNSVYFGTGSTASFNGTSDKWAYSIISLNATTGRKNWIYQVYPSSQAGQDFDFGSTPNLFLINLNNVTYQAVGLGNKDGSYYILNRINGNLLGEYKIAKGGDGIVGVAGFIYTNPNNPELFIPSYYKLNANVNGAVTAFLPASGTTKWVFETPGPVVGSVTILPGAVLFGDDSGNMYAVNSTTGKQLFHASFPNTQINTGITVAENHVLVATSFGAPNLMGVYGYTT